MDAGEKENARDCSNSGGRHSVHPGDRNLGLPMRAPVVLMGDAGQDLECRKHAPRRPSAGAGDRPDSLGPWVS